VAFDEIGPRRITRSVSPDANNTGARQETLFCAALRVALDKGFGHVTLTSVAERAGVSKGGLLYHFPTKRKLIEAMLRHYSRDDSKPTAAQSVDPLAISILIAASVDPLLLGGVANYFPDTRDGSARTPDELMQGVAKLLQVRRPR
jgi:AcrR family transcriptional regulator